MAFPANHNQLWTLASEEQVLEFLHQGMTLANIASQVGRTPNAVRMRIECIARRLLNEGSSEENVAERTRLSRNFVHEMMKDRAFDMLELESKTPEEVVNLTHISLDEAIQLEDDLDNAQSEEFVDTLKELTYLLSSAICKRLARKIRQYKTYCWTRGLATENIDVWNEWAANKDLPPYTIRLVEGIIRMTMTEPNLQ